METMNKRIKKDPKLGQDQTDDHNRIELIMKIDYCLKTLKLIIIIINISFFIGIFFLVFCEI